MNSLATNYDNFLFTRKVWETNCDSFHLLFGVFWARKFVVWWFEFEGNLLSRRLGSERKVVENEFQAHEDCQVDDQIFHQKSEHENEAHEPSPFKNIVSSGFLNGLYGTQKHRLNTTEKIDATNCNDCWLNNTLPTADSSTVNHDKFFWSTRQ